MANRRFIDFPIASTVGDNDIILIWQSGANKQTTKATLLSGLPENLEDLLDVNISGLTNGQILRYDSVTGKWENTDQGNLDLNDLNDVSIVSPSNGQVLVYNSSTSKWENSSGGFVPYVGAVTTVDLGAQGLKAGYVRFDTSIVSVPTDQGTMYWDASKSTAALVMNGTIQHIGQDTYFYVKNSSGSSIAKGTSVRFAGTDGASGHILIAPFLANGTYPSSYFMGVTAETIANGSFGQVMHFGELNGINTSGYTAGDLLYASSTVAGAFQTTAPVAPNNIVLIAAAVNSKNNGEIIIRPQIGSNINNDEGVKITSGATGDLLQLQAGGLWENKTLAQVIGSAYVPSTRTITINGTTQDLSANRTFNVGTVTSVGLSSATSGVNIGSTPVTSSGTITIAIATASGSQNGLLSSTDWNTFNNKQNALTNPITGTGTLNFVPKFTSSLGTIGNSTIQDNGSNITLGLETIVIGNITASNLSGTNTGNVTIGTANGLSLSGQILSLALASGVTTGALSSTDWTNFNNKQNALTNPVTGTGTTNYLPKFTGSTTIGNSALQETSGNLGLGVTPSAGGLAGYALFQIAAHGTSIYSGTNQTLIGTNILWSGGSASYSASTFATLYNQQSGQHQWFNAPSGTAGNAISFTQAMTLNASGQLSVGTTSTQSGTRLLVAGVMDVWSSTNTLLRFNHDGSRGTIETFTGGGYGVTSINPNGGNVLIGTTTNNGARLQVSGGINGSTFEATNGSYTVDANNEKKSGFYRWNSASTNLPESGFFSVVIYGNGDNVVAQMATHFTNANTYVRAFNSSWTAWKRLDT